jgi:hypothetical protein
MRRFIFTLLPCLAFANGPESVWVTAAMKEARSIADSGKAAPEAWLTEAEKSGFRRTGSYDECVRFYRNLEKSSRFARLQPIGESGEGRTLYALIVSNDRAFTPEAARKTRKPVVLLQNGIHAGENGGKDAAMMLLRDILISRRHQSLLDRVILLSIPVFNADGHEHISPFNRINENGPDEMGFRVNARRLNLNRDYIKSDTPEMRAWLALYNAWRPDLLIDNHVTDGSDLQYDVTFGAETSQSLPAGPRAWVRDLYMPALFAGLEKLGHVAGWYQEGRLSKGQKFNLGVSAPRFSTGYAAARDLPALLVETHSLKPFRVRVWSHYDVMKLSLQLVDRVFPPSPPSPGEPVFLSGGPDGPGLPYVSRQLKIQMYDGAAAGGKIARYLPEPDDTPVSLVSTVKSSVEPFAPAGYLIPRQWSELVELLLRHGVRVERTAKSVEGEFETYRFSNVQFARQPFEGRTMTEKFDAQLVREKRAFPAGSAWVPIDQPAGKVAMHILEPHAPDSAVRWGFLHSIFEQKEYFSSYVFEPIAAKLLQDDANLRAEFESKLASDPAFARDPRARLQWLYRRSPYFEKDKDAYPVVRVIKRTW